MNLNVVLVRTEYSTNIGASARALANMGGDRLILIDCRCELNSKAKQMAAGAQIKMRELTSYGSWNEFYENEGRGVRIALTRRGGHNRKVFSFAEIIPSLSLAEPTPGPTENLYLIFGPEADGLASDDLAFVNFACHLPVYGDFASLNLSQAVLLALHIVRLTFKPDAPVHQVTGKAGPSVQPFYFPDQLIKDWLTAMGFDVKARKASAYLTLRRLFMQNRPTAHEIRVLEAVLQQNIRKLRERSLGLAAEKLADDIGQISR